VADVHAAHPEIPIIGVGGIATADDIAEYAIVGASAIQVGTATLADPRTCGRLGTELARWCANQDVERFVDLIGTAHLDGP